MRNPLRKFPPGVTEKLLSYVYLYFEPNNPTYPFYIGKGVGDRVFDHLFEADDQTRDGKKVRKIREIWSRNEDVNIVIHRYGMTDTEAKNVESALIDVYPASMNEVAGNESSRGVLPVSEIVAHFKAKEVQIDFPCVLFTIRQHWPEVYEHRRRGDELAYERALYLATRSCWPLAPRRRPDVKRAVAVAGGIVRQIYLIKEWRQADVDGRGMPIAPNGKWLFDGEPDPAYSHLVGGALAGSQLPARGAQLPFRYLNDALTLRGADRLRLKEQNVSA
jgi:hypothetical protein